MNVLSRLLDTAIGLIVTIPLDNPLAYLYVVLNIVLQLVLLPFGGPGGGGGVNLFPF